MATKRLKIWLDGQHLADLEQRAPNDLRCTYTEAAQRQWPLNSPIISCSLPLAGRPARAEPFFRGLLPEGRALDALAARADVAASDTFGVLARYGRDIAGALLISEGDPTRRVPVVAPYTTQGLADEVAELDVRPLAVHDDSELSIAGLQNKLLLVRLPSGDWARPMHGSPSTHILKADSAARPGLVEAEGQCLTLARTVGLTTIDHEPFLAGAQQCLIVSRFDRRQSADVVVRIHQEDLCQATGRMDKYESRDRGGPGFRDAARLLERYAEHPDQQLRRLLAVATFTVAIGNADAHGKNLAFLHERADSVVVAPLYDTVPTVMWPSLRTDASMGLNGRFSMIDVDRIDLVEEASGWPLPRSVAGEVVLETLNRLGNAIAETVPDTTPLGRTLRRRVDNLLAGATAGPPADPF